MYIYRFVYLLHIARAMLCSGEKKKTHRGIIVIALILSSGKNESTKKSMVEKRRELIMIWIKSKIDLLSIMIFNAFVML